MLVVSQFCLVLVLLEANSLVDIFCSNLFSRVIYLYFIYLYDILVEDPVINLFLEYVLDFGKRKVV